MMCWQRINLAELLSYLNGRIFCSLVAKHFVFNDGFSATGEVATCSCFFPKQRRPPLCWNLPRIFLLLELDFVFFPDKGFLPVAFKTPNCFSSQQQQQQAIFPPRNVYHDEPKLMVKIWAIEQELSNASVQMVLYLDTDVTIRPDAVHWGLVPHLTRGEAARKHPPKMEMYVLLKTGDFPMSC